MREVFRTLTLYPPPGRSPGAPSDPNPLPPTGPGLATWIECDLGQGGFLEPRHSLKWLTANITPTFNHPISATSSPCLA